MEDADPNSIPEQFRFVQDLERSWQGQADQQISRIQQESAASLAQQRAEIDQLRAQIAQGQQAQQQQAQQEQVEVNSPQWIDEVLKDSGVITDGMQPQQAQEMRNAGVTMIQIARAVMVPLQKDSRDCSS